MITRLRIESKIVGFKRKEGSYTLFSKDLYGWSGKAIEYDKEEMATTFKDKNAQLLFQNDVIDVCPSGTTEHTVYVILYRERSFFLKHYNAEKSEPIGLLFDEGISIKKVGVLEM